MQKYGTYSEVITIHSTSNHRFTEPPCDKWNFRICLHWHLWVSIINDLIFLERRSPGGLKVTEISLSQNTSLVALKPENLIEFENPLRNKNLKALWALNYGTKSNISKIFNFKWNFHSFGWLIKYDFFPLNFPEKDRTLWMHGIKKNAK